MAEFNEIIELINEKELIIVFDEREHTSDIIENIKNKCKQHNCFLLSNNIAYGIKIIETCDEIIKNEVNRMDGQPHLEPVILSNLSFTSLNENCSKVKIVNDIMIELLKFKKFKLSKNEQLIFITTSESSYINDNVIYMDINSFLNFENFNNASCNNSHLNVLNIEKVSLLSIVTSLKEIMNLNYKYEIEINENDYTIVSDKHKICCLYVSSVDEISNYEMNKYNLIIVDSYKNIENNLFDLEQINDIYKIVKKPGIYFKE